MIESTEKFNLSEHILITTKLGLIRLSVNNSVLKVNRRNNQFLYAGTVLDGEASVEPFQSVDGQNPMIKMLWPNFLALI